jgi:hypothetical protein
MSNWIHYTIDVLAGSPAENNQIAEKLNQPSLELANWIAGRDGQPVSAVGEGLKGLLEFKDKFYGIVDGHLTEVSRAFPEAIFLLEHFDARASYSGK